MTYTPSRLPLTTRLVATVFTLLLTLAVGGVAVGTAGAAASTTPVTSVTIKGFKFIPNKFTVTAGIPVVVKNKDGATHDLAAVNGAFKTKYIDGGKSGKFTVKKPGTYRIVCTLHSYMTGTLTAT
ncbi:MAG TPA: cupredoxin domain-containing protein [Acidimicrobiia bacterium]|jgi:plastocyanin